MVSPEGSWRDLPNDRYQYNHVPEPEREERGAVSLALAAQVEAPAGGAQARIVAIGSPSALADGRYAYNRDFARNAFNWLVDRDVRIRVSQRDPFESRIDVRRGPEFVRSSWFALAVLPGLCVAAGLFTAWRRRREG